MMDIGKVWMHMGNGQVPVRVGMRFQAVPIELVFVLVMLVMHMAM